MENKNNVDRVKVAAVSRMHAHCQANKMFFLSSKS